MITAGSKTGITGTRLPNGSPSCGAVKSPPSTTAATATTSTISRAKVGARCRATTKTINTSPASRASPWKARNSDMQKGSRTPASMAAATAAGILAASRPSAGTSPRMIIISAAAMKAPVASAQPA